MSLRGDKTKQEIRDAAYRLFEEKGFKEVTMKDICEQTGLSRGGLYRHYETVFFGDCERFFRSAERRGVCVSGGADVQQADGDRAEYSCTDHKRNKNAFAGRGGLT